MPCYFSGDSLRCYWKFRGQPEMLLYIFQGTAWDVTSATATTSCARWACWVKRWNARWTPKIATKVGQVCIVTYSYLHSYIAQKLGRFKLVRSYIYCYKNLDRYVWVHTYVCNDIVRASVQALWSTRHTLEPKILVRVPLMDKSSFMTLRKHWTNWSIN
jgi:hypothetical protein